MVLLQLCEQVMTTRFQLFECYLNKTKQEKDTQLLIVKYFVKLNR